MSGVGVYRRERQERREDRRWTAAAGAPPRPFALSARAAV